MTQLLNDLLNIYRSIPYHVSNIISNTCSHCKQSFKADDDLIKLQKQKLNLSCDYWGLNSKISFQLDEIASKDKILEKCLERYAQANHFVGRLYDILNANPMLVPTICGLILAFVLFYFFKHNVDRILRCVQTIKQYIWQLTCWICHRSQGLDTQVTVLNDYVENFTTTNIELKKINSQLTMHIQHTDNWIENLTKEIEKCDWTTLLNITVFNDQFITNTIASACLIWIALMLAFIIIESSELAGFRHRANNAFNSLKAWLYSLKF